MILKQLIRYTNAPALEATWVELHQLPDVEVPETPAILDDEGKEVSPAVPAHMRLGDIVEVVVKCQAYSNGQMDLLRTDLGADAERYKDLIDEVEATYVPPAPAPEAFPTSCTRTQGRRALLRTTLPGHETNLLVEVEVSIAAIADPFEQQDAQIQYEAATWEIDNPFLVSTWQSLGGTEEGLRDLFRLAVTL